jgi:hypothetical protein
MTRARPNPGRATVVAALLTAVAGAALLSGGAWGARGPLRRGPVQPGLEFGGMVNGARPSATVQVGCFGPITSGQSGHPLRGQTLQVFRPEALLVDGFTGSQATRIVAYFSDDPTLTVSFDRFGPPKPVPTALTLPCSGTGSVVFAPVPASATSHTATVTVQYASQP